MKQILIIDDDEKLGQLLTQYLERYDMKVSVAMAPGKGFEILKKLKPDLLILDVMLPEKDGFEVCREIRAKSSIYGHLPILMLTAHAEVTDRIVGLELGADDYLPKPFEPRELVARVNSLFRRLEHINHVSHSGNKDRKARFADWVYDPNTLTLYHQTQPLSYELSSAEATLLNRLLQAPRQVLSRDQLLHGFADPFDRSIDVRMSRLRKKVETDPKHPTLIKTIYGAGYILTCEVSWQA